jgi:hypothetical protein
MSKIEEDAKIFCGLPPHDVFGNFAQGDGYFNADCKKKYGEEAWKAAIKKVHTEAKCKREQS